MIIMADVCENQIYLNRTIMIITTRNMLMAQLHLQYFFGSVEQNLLCFNVRQLIPDSLSPAKSRKAPALQFGQSEFQTLPMHSALRN